MKKSLCTIRFQLTLSDHRLWSTGNKLSLRSCSGFEKQHLCLVTLFRIHSTPPKLKYLCKFYYEKIQQESIPRDCYVTANWGLSWVQATTNKLAENFKVIVGTILCTLETV